MTKRRDKRIRKRAKERAARQPRQQRHEQRRRRQVREPYYLPELGLTRDCWDRDTRGERENLPPVIRTRREKSTAHD